MAKPSNDARALLQRLVEDDEFRAKMELEPIAAFAEYGYEIDPSIVPFAVTLPSKDHIKQNEKLLAKQIEATNGWVWFCR